MKQVKHLSRSHRRQLVDQDRFYDLLVSALERYDPYWEETCSHDDVFFWVEERWPLPQQSLLNMRYWAERCFEHLQAGEGYSEAG
jgi:hypothetical protein